MNDLAILIREISVWAIPLVIAITFHEAAHGFVAKLFGDRTAWMLGRVTFNPLKHIDPFGTLVLPGILLLFRAATGSGILFGYAKPVPVDFRNLRNPKRDMIWVALAGPATNVVLAIVSMLLLHLIAYLPGPAILWASANLSNSARINVTLAVLNMLPIPPLDGGRVMVGILPRRAAIRYAEIERYGMFIVLGGFFLLPMIGNQLGIDLNILGYAVAIPAGLLLQALARLTGVG